MDALIAQFNDCLRVSTTTDISAVTAAVEKLIPADENARIELSEHEPFFSSLKGLLDTIAAVDDKDPSSATYKQQGVVIAKLIAETAKAEEARTPIAQADVIPSLVQVYRLGARHLVNGTSTAASDCVEDDLKVQTYRALANLCFDNESNRDIVLETPDAIKHLVAGLKSENRTVLTTACGALLNISMDNEPVQVEALNAGALPRVMHLIQLSTDQATAEAYADVGVAAIRLLSNIVESGRDVVPFNDPVMALTHSLFKYPEKGVEDLVSSGGLKQLLGLLQHRHTILLSKDLAQEQYESALEILEALTIVLETIAENDNVQRSIVSSDLLDILLDFVDHRPTFQPSPDTLEEDQSTYHDIRKTVSRIVTLVTMNDANMADMPQKPEIINRFKKWMTSGLTTGNEAEEDEIRMSGALCIGNLARSDETCTALVHRHGVAQDLLDLLKLEIGRVRASGVREETKSTVKVLHAVIGALKNLSLAAPDRAILGSLGTVGPVAELLEIEGVKPVQYGCVGILKNLCAGFNEANAYRVITGQEPPSDHVDLAKMEAPASLAGTPLGKLISLIWTSTGDNDTGIRNEGGRVIVNISRTCHRAKALHFTKAIVEANAIAPLIQIITGALLTKGRPGASPATADSSADNVEEGDDHHVHFDSVPLDGQVFPVVQNEGIVALILVTNGYPAAIPRVARYHTFLVPALIKILKSGIAEDDNGTAGPRFATPGETQEYKDETKVNVCLLLEALCKGDDEFRTRVSSDVEPIVNRLNAAVSASSPATSPASHVQAHHEQIVAPTSPPLPISRTSTKSAKNLTESGPSRKELQLSMGRGAQVSVDKGVGLREAVGRLMLVL
ncbi:Rap1 GTPase-GDP dissociation stimulator 1 [Borealophlyctis nickersoniae]|nr:Rap1 GTPase-GDP dissociation stimulator 1 [Borealophlyctis nickersoniae]